MAYCKSRAQELFCEHLPTYTVHEAVGMSRWVYCTLDRHLLYWLSALQFRVDLYAKEAEDAVA